MKETTALSPQDEAQVVLNAYLGAPGPCRFWVAAALRAAAMRTLLTSEHYEGSTPNDYELGWNAAVAYIQNIAAELEGSNG